jgi:chemotaxis family two-component system sensor kinase Cph1
MEWKRMAPQPEPSRREALEAQALLCALTELSARAGHDLIAPLNQAGSLLALFVKRYRNQVGSEADELLEFLQSASTTMEGLVAGIRRYLEIAGRAPSFEPVDLNASLASCLALLDKRISECAAVIESESLPVVSADAAQMAALFGILIGNSIKFRQADTPPRIRISSKRVDHIVVVAIADNGIGIDPEFSETVFLPFRRLNNGKEYPGTGLGLAMAKLIIELHGGNIRIDPAQASAVKGSSGASVQFTLPGHFS